MKKIIFFISLTSLIYADNSLNTEDFFYERGYENGYGSGYEQGVKDAFKEAKKMLENYKNELRAYELGKYLIKNQNLTYPQVWQEVDKNGVVKFRITPSKIEKEINIDELFSKFANIPTKKFNDNSNIEIKDPNSVELSYRDSNINYLPQKVSQEINKKVLALPKNSKILDILKKSKCCFF